MRHWILKGIRQQQGGRRLRQPLGTKMKEPLPAYNTLNARKLCHFVPLFWNSATRDSEPDVYCFALFEWIFKARQGWRRDDFQTNPLESVTLFKDTRADRGRSPA